MIVLFTDFGWNGPYVGQMKSVLAQQAPGIPVIDLMHDVPKFNPKAGAYLLASLIDRFPKGTIFVCVVDPGVGSARLPCVVNADDYWFVGPDNDLFDVVISHSVNKHKWEITWIPEKLSATFHGRDLFAPVAAQILKGKLINSNRVKSIECTDTACQPDLYEIIYIDDFGNCMTGIKHNSLSQYDYSETILHCKDRNFSFANTFSAVSKDEIFYFINSNNLIELAINCGNLAETLDIKIGDHVVFPG